MKEIPDIGHLEGRTVLVTGGAGFFGRHFAAALLDGTRESKLIVYSRDEAKHARMADALRRHADRLRFRLGDVRDRDRLRLAVWGVDVIVHAAALKRIDDTARQTFEVVRTNVIGTQNVLAAAIDGRIERTLVISSDKGVLPINSYGATKFLAERLAVEWNAIGFARGQRIAALRYGNVVGSTGSVVHLFRRAARAGEAVPLTDGRMTRFWMTAAQAVGLACQALRIMRGGEIFVAKLPAAPVSRLALAVAPHCPLRHTARRPGGEKSHETLLSETESERAVDLGPLWVVEPEWALPVQREPWKGSQPPEGFQYASDTAEARLSVEELAQMAAEVPDETV